MLVIRNVYISQAFVLSALLLWRNASCKYWRHLLFWSLMFFNVVETVTLRTRTFIPLHYDISVIKIVFILQLFFFFCFGKTVHSGPGPPHLRGFQLTHNEAPQSVWLLWTSDQLVQIPLPDNTQHSKQNPCPRRNLSGRVAADLRLRLASIGTGV